MKAVDCVKLDDLSKIKLFKMAKLNVSKIQLAKLDAVAAKPHV
jgi:hypothetical protein